MHEVRESTGHSDIHTTEHWFVRTKEDADLSAPNLL